MHIHVGRVSIVAGFIVIGLLGSASVAPAQYRPPSKPAIGEDYHIEASYGWWNADPSLIVNSESLGIVGTDIDLVSDLGIVSKKLGKFDLVLRPAKKHRFRFEYLPIRYEADTVIQRSFVFNGQRYNLGLPVQTAAEFKTYRFGYEYDFLYFTRGFAGVLVDLKYTNVNVELVSPIGAEYTTAAAPIPTIGFVGRGYVTPNFAVGGEMSFFRVPDSLGEQYNSDGRYTDFEIYGTYNVNKYVGTQVGYRSVDIFYDVDNDTGALKFKGLYFGGVIRY